CSSSPFTAGLRLRPAAAVCLAAVVLGALTVRYLAEEPGDGGQYDLLIVHGHIIDGSGSPWFEGSVAVKDGKIQGVGRLINPTAKRVIDASGLVVAPGVSDLHSHADFDLLADARAQRHTVQGTTTAI